MTDLPPAPTPPTPPRPDPNIVLQAAVVVGLVAIAIGFIWRDDDANDRLSARVCLARSA